MANSGTLANTKSVSITGSGSKVIDIDYPVIALAFGWCAISFSGTAALAGNKLKVAMDDLSVDVVLDNYGNADVSLLPFIKAYMARAKAQDLPLKSNGTATHLPSAMRGYFEVNIEDYATQHDTDIMIYFVYGENELKSYTDRYISYNTGDSLGTWQTLDYYASNAIDGTPSDGDAWVECNYNLNRHLNNPSSVEQLPVTIYKGDKIVNTTINYHLIDDCRVQGVMAVKWLDSLGGINIRKLIKAGEQNGAGQSNAYSRFHVNRNIVNDGYYHGEDSWTQIETTRTIRLGDDGVPLVLYDWLKGLVSSPVVELWDGAVNGEGVWVRCNLADASLEMDTKKSTFTIAVTLQVPTIKAQEF